MSSYGIFTDSGNAIEWHETEQAVLQALGEIVDAAPEAMAHIAAIAFDDEGNAFGEAIHAPRRVLLITPSPFLQPGHPLQASWPLP